MFEWDEDKNQTNLEKHGVAFEDVLSVFASREALSLEDRRKGLRGAPVCHSLPLGDTHHADLCPARQQAGEAGL
jgi:hypothetical protein